MTSAAQAFLQKFPLCQVQKPLAPLNTMHIGGPADLYYKITNIELLPPIIEEARRLDIPYYILGGGSNNVFADEGLRGLVLHLQARAITMEDGLIAAEAGTLLSQVVQYSLQRGLMGMEHFMGLPGTVGGAVRGNAGAFGTEIKDIFAKAILYEEIKGVFEAGPDYFDFGYRHSSLKQNRAIVLKVFLKLRQATPEELEKSIGEAQDIVKNRISKQPKGFCSGSFFKNPGSQQGKPHDPTLKAGYLLEQADCKGLQVGDMRVSDQHANWILNLGKGTQKELLELSQHMQARVKAKFGLDLEREVQLVRADGRLLGD